MDIIGIAGSDEDEAGAGRFQLPSPSPDHASTSAQEQQQQPQQQNQQGQKPRGGPSKWAVWGLEAWRLVMGSKATTAHAAISFLDSCVAGVLFPLLPALAGEHYTQPADRSLG